MIIRNIVHNKHSVSRKMESGTYYSGRIGFWGEVKEIDSVHGCVDVISDQGIRYNAIPVYSREWIVSKDSYTCGERFLPPQGARVFVLTPTRTVEGAFVLCSGYPTGEKSLQSIFAQNETESETKQNQYERITQGGWDIAENYLDGNITLDSADKNISIQANLAKNGKLKQEQGITVKAWNNLIEITSDGIKITDKNKNKITTVSSGIKTEDCNGNVIETTTTSVKINGNLEVLQ